MADQIRKNVPNFIPMGQAGGERVKQETPTELDAEGKPINPHIPQFISKAPWYLDSGAKSSLKHQRLNEKDTPKTESKDNWYKRGERVGPAATKYRKGACENCGASTHKTKDCLERPRKVGAKWSGRDIQADELLQTVETTWDSKRDRSNGYDFDSHTAMLKRTYDRIESLRADKADNNPSQSDDIQPQSMADQTKSNSNSHMRIREDTASYLAKDAGDGTYDPKTRAMKHLVPSAGTSIDKADFTRGSKDVAEFSKMQAFAWTEPTTSAPSDQTKDKNAFGDVHLQGTPSQAAMIYKQRQEAKAAEKASILSKYGDETRNLPSHLLEVEATEKTYSKEGTLLTQKQPVKSRYTEDVLSRGHLAIWGSWYDKEANAWGYACCKATLKNAYCTASKQ